METNNSSIPSESAVTVAPGMRGGRRAASRWSGFTDWTGVNVAIAAFGLTLMAAIWGVVIVQVDSDEQEILRNVQRQNSNLARALEEQTTRTLKGIDGTLLVLRNEYMRLGRRLDIARSVEQYIAKDDVINMLSIVNERGDVVLSDQPVKSMNVADREHFQIQHQTSADNLYIGRPFQSRRNSIWLIPVTRRINKPDGSFGGIVVALIDPSYFTSFYSSTELGDDGLVQLVGLDGIVRARHTGRIASFGQDSSKSSLLLQQATNPVGSYLSKGRLENVPRYTSYRTLPHYPLIVAVGISKSEVTAAIERRSRIQYGGALLISVVIALLSVLLMAALVRQRHATSALAAREKQFRAVFDHAAMGIALDGPGGRFAAVNQKLCDMLGYTREELLDMGYRDIVPNVNSPKVGMTRLLAGEVAAFSSEKPCVRKDGSLILTNKTISLVRDSAGNPQYFIRLIEDISERKRAEERFRATFEQAAVGFAHTSIDRRFLLVNQKFCDMLGYTREELLALDLSRIAPPDEKELGTDAKRALAGEFDTYTGERRYARKDGSIFWARRTISLVRDEAGVPQYFIRVVEDVSEHRKLQQQLEHMAHHDSLTALPNRNLICDRLKHALEQARRRGRLVGVMFIDLDRFKIVNDTLGHGVGDQLLMQVAARLKISVRAEDTVGRLGGDEFAIVLAELPCVESAGVVANKLIDALTMPFDLEGREIFITASIGIATFPENGASFDVLIQNADVAMYEAKARGKNNHQYYSAAMNQRAAERMQMENNLRYAIERNEFVLHFQPKASLASGRISGVEALLRWQCPGAGLVSPAEFIPLLEESGLIMPVGEWVLRAACAQIRAWRDAGLAPVPVAVNLSARQFRQLDFCELVNRAIREFDVPPHLLELEITESAAMDDAEQVIAVLHDLKALGVRISIDDFGTGYSSLSYLKRFPIDTLKIDRSFVIDLPGDQNAASIARAVIAMAHGLQLKVVAEGVENVEQLAFLADHSCDEMQGYYFSKPLSALQCSELLTEQRKLSLPPITHSQKFLAAA